MKLFGSVMVETKNFSESILGIYNRRLKKARVWQNLKNLFLPGQVKSKKSEITTPSIYQKFAFR